MNLFARRSAAQPARIALAAVAGALATVPASAHEIDALLDYLDDLVSARSEADGFAVFYVDLRRSDRTAALAGRAAARAGLDALRGRLHGLLRDGDRFALHGVEDLLVVLPRVDSIGRATLVASRLIQALQQPERAGGNAMRVRPAIGCALFPLHGRDGESLIAAADDACRKARGTGEGWCIADERGETGGEEALARRLEEALAANELEVHLQPQLDIRSGTFDAAEALIRWPRPPGIGPVSASTIVDIAERRGMMPALTLFVLNTVLRRSASLRQRGIDLRIAVNVSASTLLDAHLPQIVQQSLQLWDVPPDRLTLEVTESMLMHDAERTLATMNALKALGTGLSLDDFGTGYSSFAYLQRMPLDELKIDQLFVRNLRADCGTATHDARGGLRIVRSMIDIAHNFDLRTVAEGVEDEATMALLEGLGCDTIQGYHTCRPMPLDDVEDWWRARAGRRQ